MNRLQEILSIEGIVVRHIPKRSKLLWGFRDGDERSLKDGEELVVIKGRKFVKETRQNELAGYAITLDETQGTIVKFYKHTAGFGPTIEDAYDDFCTKREVTWCPKYQRSIKV